VAIASILSLPVLPRAKFFQNMIFNLMAIGIGACIAMLTCYSSVRARLNTSDPTSSSTIGASGTHQALQYNSSASAVSAVWLFFNIMFANALRFSRPQLQLPIILYSIFANVSVCISNVCCKCSLV
jgi:Na+/melibiose symporter-like transporter